MVYLMGERGCGERWAFRWFWLSRKLTHGSIPITVVVVNRRLCTGAKELKSNEALYLSRRTLHRLSGVGGRARRRERPAARCAAPWVHRRRQSQLGETGSGRGAGSRREEGPGTRCAWSRRLRQTA